MKGSALVVFINLCEKTSCMISPARMFSLAFSTVSKNFSFVKFDWTLSIEMSDFAGNNRTLSTSIDIQGREATSSEQLFALGTLYNFLAIFVVISTAIITWFATRRLSNDEDLDMIHDLEIIDEISED